MKNLKPTAETHWPKRTGSYGLTAVTLGEVLKDQLDKVVAATAENRSEIIRKALQRYFEELPELQKRRGEDREKARELQYAYLFSCIVGLFWRVMHEFDYPDAQPLPQSEYQALYHAVDDARDWLASQLPSGLPYRLPNEMNLALAQIKLGFHRLFIEADKPEWQREGVDRWRKKVKGKTDSDGGRSTVKRTALSRER